MSSTFSLGETVDTVTEAEPAAEKEFDEVVNKIKETSLEESDPVTRPTKPHHTKIPTETGSVVSDNTDDRDATEAYKNRLRTCLFCNIVSDEIAPNLEHMAKTHGMFIPEQQYLINLEGLLNYLYEKIHDFRECLWCGKASSSAFGIQTHMRDSGHCKIAYSTEDEQIEIGDYYDFRSTYSDAGDEDVDMSDDAAAGGVKLGASRAERIIVEGDTTGSDASAPEEDAGWETDSTVSSVPTDEISKVYVDGKGHLYGKLHSSRHHSHHDPRPHRNRDGFHSKAHAIPHAVYHDDFELHMPSGRTAGHRDFNKYFKQNLRNRPVTLEEKLEARRIADAELAARAAEDEDVDEMDVDGEEGEERPTRGRQLVSRANGGLGMIGVSDAKKKEVAAVEKREKKRELRAQTKQLWGNEKRANFQKHFRVSLVFFIIFFFSICHFCLFQRGIRG